MPNNIKNTLAIAFKLPPKKAIEYLKSKGKNIITSLNWDDYVSKMGKYAHKEAFTIAKVAKADILQTVLDELKQAQENGKGLDEFKKSATERLQTAGWTGDLKPSRLTTIYNTNLQVAYANGQYNSLTELGKDTDKKYWQFRQVKRNTANDGHKFFDGKVFAMDDIIWDYIFPPCNYNCKCSVVAYSQKELDALGLKVSQGNIYVPYVKANRKWFGIQSTKSFKPDTNKYDPKLKSMIEKDLNNG